MPKRPEREREQPESDPARRSPDAPHDDLKLRGERRERDAREDRSEEQEERAERVSLGDRHAATLAAA
jgi:hypothetical protein